MNFGLGIPTDGVVGDSGGNSGRRARAGRDILCLCLSRLEPRVPIHLHSPDAPRLTVVLSIERNSVNKQGTEKLNNYPRVYPNNPANLRCVKEWRRGRCSVRRTIKTRVFGRGTIETRNVGQGAIKRRAFVRGTVKMRDVGRGTVKMRDVGGWPLTASALETQIGTT